MNAFNINTVYPFWWIIFCLTGGIIYAAFLYWYKNKEWNETPKTVLYFLSFLRFAVVSILLFLLLEPFLKTTYYTQVPANVVFLQDNSQSVLLNKDSSYYRENYPEEINTVLQRLSTAEHLQVTRLTFGNEVQKNDSLTFSQPYTNIHQALKQTEELFSGQKLAAVILASDGIFTRGQNPLYWTNSGNVKLLTVGLGDTSVQRDALVKQLFVNDLVLLNNDFEVNFQLVCKQLNGQRAKVKITHNGKEEFTKDYIIKKNDFQIEESVILHASEAGWQQYELKIEPFDGEISLKNNVKTFFVKVIDSRSKILLLAAAPNPDVAAIKRAVEKNKNIDLTVAFEPDFTGSFAPYSLIILHQIPNNTTSVNLMNRLRQAKKNIWFIGGSQLNAVKFNTFGLKKIPASGKFNYATPVLSANFDLFNISDDQKRLFRRLSPLQVPFGKPAPVPGETVLFYQQIGQVKTTYPLMSFYTGSENKYAYLAGEGIWRWRMQNYELAQNFEAFDTWVNNMIEYLSVKQDKSLLQIAVKSEWNENENIIFSAKLYNPAYELITTSDIDLAVVDANGKKFTYKMLPSKNGYFLDIGTLPVGIYTYTAKAQVQGKPVQNSGKLVVKPVVVEAVNTRADFLLLQKMAAKNNGKFYTPAQWQQLIDDLLADKAITATLEEQKDYQPLIHYKWLFAVLMLFASIEWFARKWYGNV